MIDLYWTDLSLGLSLIFIISYLCYVVLFYNKYALRLNSGNEKKTNKWLLLFSLVLIILVSPGSGSDWFSYQQMVWNYDFNEGAVNHGEPIYRYIIKFVNQNYLLFRLVVWGGALLLSCLAFRRFDININNAVYFLTAVFLLRYNYARASLAMASYFLGISYLAKPINNKKILNLLMIVLLFWGAYEFHHSMLPVLILSLVVFLPLEKPPVLVLLLVILPVMAFIISRNFMIIELLDDEYLIESFQRYIELDSGKSNFLGYVANTLLYGAFVIPLLFNSVIIARNYKNIEKSIKRLYRVALSIALLAASFLFMGLSSMIFVYRYLFMTFIPITILSIHFYQNGLMSRRSFSFIVIWGVFSNIQPLITGLYHRI